MNRAKYQNVIKKFNSNIFPKHKKQVMHDFAKIGQSVNNHSPKTTKSLTYVLGYNLGIDEITQMTGDVTLSMLKVASIHQIFNKNIRINDQKESSALNATKYYYASGFQKGYDYAGTNEASLF